MKERQDQLIAKERKLDKKKNWGGGKKRDGVGGSFVYGNSLSYNQTTPFLLQLLSLPLGFVYALSFQSSFL